MKYYQDLAGIIDGYDVLLVDLWGVIHDGVTAYPGVHEALARLRHANRKIIFISNAPRRAYKAIEGLNKLGIGSDLYDKVITSGEIAFEYLQHNTPGAAPPTGNANHYIIIGPERDAGLLRDTNYIRVQNVHDAAFMIVTGFDDDHSPVDEKLPYLHEAIKINLPMICANPDMAIVRISGQQALCAGVIAKQYEEMGGDVIYFGKPYREIYEKALALAGYDNKSRIAAIGDNLETDIKGANNFGIDSYLIPGGMLGPELGITHGELPDAAGLQKICDRYGVVPTGVLPAFV